MRPTPLCAAPELIHVLDTDTAPLAAPGELHADYLAGHLDGNTLIVARNPDRLTRLAAFADAVPSVMAVATVDAHELTDHVDRVGLEGICDHAGRGNEWPHPAECPVVDPRIIGRSGPDAVDATTIGSPPMRLESSRCTSISGVGSERPLENYYRPLIGHLNDRVSRPDRSTPSTSPTSPRPGTSTRSAPSHHPNCDYPRPTSNGCLGLTSH